MNLKSPKVTPEEKVDLCKKYFYLGWLLFPFAWAVNAIWFYPEAFRKPEFQVSHSKIQVKSGCLNDCVSGSEDNQEPGYYE